MLGSQVADKAFSCGNDCWTQNAIQINFDLFNGTLCEDDRLVLCIHKESTYCKFTIDFEFKIGTDMEKAREEVAKIIKEQSQDPYDCEEPVGEFTGFGEGIDNKERRLYWEDSDQDSASEDEKED